MCNILSQLNFHNNVYPKTHLGERPRALKVKNLTTMKRQPMKNVNRLYALVLKQPKMICCKSAGVNFLQWESVTKSNQIKSNVFI